VVISLKHQFTKNLFYSAKINSCCSFGHMVRVNSTVLEIKVQTLGRYGVQIAIKSGLTLQLFIWLSSQIWSAIMLSGWMFLLVLVHPGCPRHSPESCKMVVVVVVAMLTDKKCKDLPKPLCDNVISSILRKIKKVLFASTAYLRWVNVHKINPECTKLQIGSKIFCC